MLPILGLLAACVLMAIGNVLENDTIFLLSSIMLVVFGVMYFKR